jgi:hypothetical protein
MSGGFDPQVLVPPFILAGKELAAVAAIDGQSARALGGNHQADGQHWGCLVVWSPRVPPPLAAAIWRLLLHDLVVWLCSLAVSMAGAGAWASLGAMEGAVPGRCGDRSGPPSTFNFHSSWDVPTDQCATWCTCVETRACGRAAMGVVREAVEAEGVVCSRRLVALGPGKGTESHTLPLTAWIVNSGRVRCVYTPCKSLQVKPRAGQPSLCTLYTQP